MKTAYCAIVGGGASGIVAAISARRKGHTVVLCEKMPRLGKKILVSGAGRCNLLNETLDESFYNQNARRLVRSIFQECGKDAIEDFFKDMGIRTYSDHGRIFPVTNQAASVMKALEIELERLAIPVVLSFDVIRVSSHQGRFALEAKDGRTLETSRLILAGGGMSYPSLGSDGRCYAFARQFGHKLIEPVPIAVPVIVKDPMIHFLQGQRISALVQCVIDQTVRGESSGEILFTKYGLSGTAVLDISDTLSVAINRTCAKRNVIIRADLVPFMKKEALLRELEQRIRRKTAAEDLLVGILPNKFGLALRGLLEKQDAGRIADHLKHKTFEVIGTRGWNEAEFTSGGIDIRDVAEGSLESKLKNGLYFAGEILDVEGRRGGYNLAWAWASGLTAGLIG